MISAISCVCVVSAMDDGNCSPLVTCNSSVVQESIRWKGDLWWLSGGRPQTGFVTCILIQEFVDIYTRKQDKNTKEENIFLQNIAFVIDNKGTNTTYFAVRTIR